MFYQISRTQAAETAEKGRFMSLVTLTFDLDLQTRPSERPNTSSAVWIWRKSFQQLPRYFTREEKSHRLSGQRQKQNLPQFTACGSDYYN